MGAWIDSANAHLADASLAHRMSIRVRHGTGRWVWLMLAGKVVDRSQEGRPLHMAGVAMDVQAQKAMEQQLRMAARTDGLTQLPNRSVVLDSIRAALLRRRAQPGYHFAVLFLDVQNRMLAMEELFRGTLTQTSVYPREVVLRALHHHASAVVLAHNHPSGSVAPSRADETLTQTLKAALALVDVRVLDHVIVAPGQALSMAEKGLV